jgi:gamma-glutamylcyclotransferase (GGCT)/AIG2-like uncharacterized protein YtfP
MWEAYPEEIVIPPNEPILLFVYGSIKKGHKHHGMLRGSSCLGKVSTEPNYLLYDTGPYPGMIAVKDGEGRSIEGELYLVSSETLKMMDTTIPYTFKKQEIKLITEGDLPPHKIITHIYTWSVAKFLDCGQSWPRT